MTAVSRHSPGRVVWALWLALALNAALWGATRAVYPRWAGVPPVPTRAGALAMALGDPEFAYRFFGSALQNLGDVGRDVTPLKDYSYKKLGEWFFLLHGLDPVSNHVPMVAAYYFGATYVPADAAEIVRYLRAVGDNPRGEKWRWLAQAAVLAQHRVHDMDLALDIAYRLAQLGREGVALPQWARQMPAFVLRARGDHDAARQLMTQLLLSEPAGHPEEVNFMASFLVDQLGADPAEVDMLLRMRSDQFTEKQNDSKN